VATGGWRFSDAFFSGVTASAKAIGRRRRASAPPGERTRLFSPRCLFPIAPAPSSARSKQRQGRRSRPECSWGRRLARHRATAIPVGSENLVGRLDRRNKSRRAPPYRTRHDYIKIPLGRSAELSALTIRQECGRTSKSKSGTMAFSVWTTSIITTIHAPIALWMTTLPSRASSSP
jgi:hypothetical protein